VTLRLGFLASHGGSNVQVIVDACRSGALDAEPCVLVSNNSDAPVMARTRAAGIATYHLSSHTHPEPSLLDDAILEALTRHGAALIVLAGYMKKIGPRTLARYRGLVLNIHPALLPKFGGQGMYGRRVHEEVLAAGDRVTGVTVHLADEEYDRGPILAQREVPVVRGDTVDSLAARVLEAEHALYVETLARIARGEIRLAGLPV
jgi:phosphoribosylglycinamide formyltransferase-1